jgi:hypothetical protein
MPDLKDALHIGGKLLNPVMSAHQVWSASQSSEQSMQILSETANEIGLTSVQELGLNSSFIQQALNQYDSQTNREVTKAAGSLATIPLGLVAGMGAGMASDKMIDAAYGVQDIDTPMQALGMAREKVQNGEPLTASDVAMIIPLTKTEKDGLFAAVGTPSEENMALAYDQSSAVIRRAELLVGRPLEMGESATQKIADYLNTSGKSPALLLVNEIDLPSVAATAPVVAKGVAGNDPLMQMSYDGTGDPLMDMGYGSSGTLTSPTTPAKPNKVLGVLKHL